MNQEISLNQKSRLEKAGVWLSVLCAVHCVSMPLLVALLPLLGSEMLHNPVLELSLIGTTVAIAGFIIGKDYLRVHRNLLPVGLLAVGVLAKLLGLFVLEHSYEPVVITSGAAFFVLAFIANWRLRAQHHACKCEH